MLILDILICLYNHSDINRHLTVSDIEKYINESGEKPQRKTIISNLERLATTFGGGKYFSIEFDKNDKGAFEYWVDVRPIDLYEAITIANAICENNSLEMPFKKEITEKIAGLIGDVSKKQFFKTINSTFFDKSDIRHVSYVAEVLSDAIESGNKVELKYSIDPSNKNEYKSRFVSPYKIIQKRNFNYLLGKCDSHENDISFFRLDRIIDLVILEEKAVNIKANINDYIDFPLISLGESVRVTMDIDREHIGFIYDRYGYDVKISDANGKARIVVKDKLCEEFLGWLFMLGESVDIAEPSNVRERYIERLEGTLSKIKGR